MKVNRIFAGVYNIFTRFPVKKDRVTLVEKLNTGGTGNLFSVKEELEKRGPYHFNIITHDDYALRPGNIFGLLRLFTVKCFRMATSSMIFLNDNFLPLGGMKLPGETKVIQLWHGMGSFKKFGASTEKEEAVLQELEETAENVTAVMVSAEGIRKNYEEALLVPAERIHALGNPQGDYYFASHDLKKLRSSFHDRYPQLAGRKLVLYAPTFRGDAKEDERLLSHFDFDRFEKELGADYALAVRLHPMVRSAGMPAGVTDLTDYENVRELLLLADLLITDYSSIVVEYALLEKPVILYAFDKDRYLSQDRGFYYDYETTAPGPIVTDMDALIDCIRRENWDFDKIHQYALLHNDHFDDQSARRVVDYVLWGKLYTAGKATKEAEKMKIIAGLGNPTDKYKNTRHNAGFMAIDRIADTYGIRINQLKHKALVGSGMIEGQKVLLMKPLTYMNNSGEAIRDAAAFYKTEPEDVLVIYDDISLEPGMMRIRKKGSAGGHNGMKSIINHLGSDNFPRMRIGIGGEKHPDHDLVDYVLGQFSGEELKKLEEVFEIVPAAAALVVSDEIDESMNRYNTGRKSRKNSRSEE